MSSEEVLSALKETANSLSLESVSQDSVKLGSSSFPADAQCTVSGSTYSLLSIALLLVDPSQKFLAYKRLCKKYNVKDGLNTSDVKTILEYFEASGEKKEKKVRMAEDVIEKEPKKAKTSKDEKKASSSISKKKEKGAPMTQEQIMESLGAVVDKRSQDPDGDVDMEGSDKQSAAGLENAEGGGDDAPKLISPEDEERKAIQACLSAVGYDATKVPAEVLEKDRAEVNDKIANFEIPVGDSASILRCGAAATTGNSKKSGSQSSSERNFSRVLDLFMQSAKEEKVLDKRDKRSRSGTPTLTSPQPKKKAAGKPIIIVPNAMTSPITLINALQFFQHSKFEPRDIAIKNQVGPKQSPIFVKRTVASRLGGGEVEYEIIDNPSRKLKSPADWDRVVAVIAQGAAWQFKGWGMVRGREATPVDVFSHAFGYYIGIEGAPVPKELLGWNVKKGNFSRDKRGLDSVVYANFWNNLDEWMSVHKRHYLPG